MKTPTILALLLIMALSVTSCPALEKVVKKPANSGKKKLLLFAKNPADWTIITKGSSGKLVYHEANGSYTFHAVKLRPRTAYALIRYADDPPKGDILARGVSDANGRLELGGTWRNWTKKFWLMSGDDVSGAPGETGSLRAWHPESYLFEEKPLGMVCNCPEPEEP